MGFLLTKQNNMARRQPFQELENWHRDLNRIFDLSFPGMARGESSLMDGGFFPAVDVIDRSSEIEIKADLPGFSKDDVDITIDNNILSIRGEKKQETAAKEGDVIRSERYAGIFQRAFTLPASIDPQKVRATFNNGVLELVIAKREEAKPRQVKIDVK